MTLTKYPNGVSSFGLPVIGGAFTSTGKVFFVDSNTGSNSYDGRDKTQPFSTLTYALSKCTANKYDIIYLMPGHDETIASEINVNKASVSIIALGHGLDRAEFSMMTNTTACFKVSAADVHVENIIFNSDTDSLEHPIYIVGGADDLSFLNCEWRVTGGCTTEKHHSIIYATSADRVLIDGFRYADDTSFSSGSPIFVEACDEIEIKNCVIITTGTSVSKSYGTAPLYFSTCNVSLDMNVHDNILIQLRTSAADDAAALFIGSTGTVKHTGIIHHNYLAQNTDANQYFLGSTTKAYDNATVCLFQNYVVNIHEQAAWVWADSPTTAVED